MLSGNTLLLEDFKCFENSTIAFAPITVLTGVNSGGKTSVITALLLLKHFYDASSVINERVWPRVLGGVPIGAQETYPSFGSGRDCKIRLDGSSSASLSISSEEFQFSSTKNCPILDSMWRVCSILHLPLTSEQDTGKRSLESDTLLDNRHSLLELLALEHRRKHGSAAHSVPLRAVVEHILGSVTSPVYVDISRTDFESKLRLVYGGTSIESESSSPEQTGAGVTAALPVVIHLAASVRGEVVVLQDPEAHLHPRGQSLIGREIAKAAARGIGVVVETHSEHLVNGIKLGLLELEMDPSNDLACYYFNVTKGRSIAARVEIDSRGLTREWPQGFFDQAERDLSQLAKRLANGA